MFPLQAVTAEPNVHGGREGQAGGPQEEGLRVGPGDIEARVGLSRADLRPRASGPENMTTAQNGHGRGAAVPDAISDPKDLVSQHSVGHVNPVSILRTHFPRVRPSTCALQIKTRR